MKKRIEEYKDYINFLNDWILSCPNRGRGIKAKMAKFIGCDPIHITRVLRRDLNLTLEQTAKLITYLELTELEGKYFLGLVEWERAGNQELKEMVEGRLNEYKRELAGIGRAPVKREEYPEKDMDTFFSSYLYSAIEVACNLEGLQTASNLSEYFNIPQKRTMEILSFFVKLGVLEKRGDRYVHLAEPKFRELTPKQKRINATNWRNRVIASLEYDSDIDFHRDLCFTIDSKSIESIKKDMLDFLVILLDKYFKEEEIHKLSDDRLCAICLDFFEVK